MPESATPQIVVIGGPNGAGKSTLARLALPEAMPFVNADEIAKTLPDHFSGNRDLEAGRLLLARVEELSAANTSFALETTLSNRSLAARIRRLRAKGWSFRLIFVWVPSAETSILRVAARVRRGGHHIPEETIRRRYAAGLKNLTETYLPLADSWLVYQNAEEQGPQIVATGGPGRETAVYDAQTWATIKQAPTDEA